MVRETLSESGWDPAKANSDVTTIIAKLSHMVRAIIWINRLSSDTPDLKDKEKVTQLQSKVNSHLRDYSASRYPQKVNRLGKLLLCLPTLRLYSEKAMENYVTLEFFGKLDMPPLVAELMEWCQGDRAWL